MRTKCFNSDCFSVNNCTMFPCIFFLLVGLPLAGGMESGIIGGKEAKPHSRPYMASIQCRNHHMGDADQTRLCPDSSPLFELFKHIRIKMPSLNKMFYSPSLSSSKDHFEVVLGAHNIKKKEKTQQRIPVIQYIPHPMFDRNNKNYSYDIMLLKLKKKAKLNQFVKVMPLPKKDKYAECSIAGWGTKNPTGNQASDEMWEVKLKLQENSKCEEMWQYFFNSERMICTVSDGKHAFCRGDSGSPLMCNNKPQGIASFTTDNCVNKTYPQNYVKISYFLRWIKKNIK